MNYFFHYHKHVFTDVNKPHILSCNINNTIKPSVSGNTSQQINDRSIVVSFGFAEMSAFCSRVKPGNDHEIFVQSFMTHIGGFLITSVTLRCSHVPPAVFALTK